MQYVGLDASKESVVAVFKDKDGKKLDEGTYPCNQKGLEKLASDLKDCQAMVESSTTGQYVYRQLDKAGIKIKMANPSRIGLITKSEKKTDRNDADVLADLLRTNLLPTCYVPPQKIMERRELTRQRDGLVQQTTRLKNQMHALLTSEGISCPYADIFGKTSKEWLDGCGLSPTRKGYLLQLKKLAGAFEDEISILEKTILEQACESDEMTLLDTMPGVAPLSALTIMAEIGDIKRFKTPEQLCSYAGLVPIVRQSGSVDYKGSVKSGNKALKAILIKDAHSAARWNPRFRRFCRRLEKKKGKSKAITAVAHKMLRIMWFMLQRGKPFDESILCHKRAG